MRRNVLSIKYAINYLSIQCRQGIFWENSHILNSVQSLVWIKNVKKDIFQIDTLPTLNLQQTIFPLKIHYLNLNAPNLKWVYMSIFMNGSLNNGVGVFMVHIPVLNINFPPQASDLHYWVISDMQWFENKDWK